MNDTSLGHLLPPFFCYCFCITGDLSFFAFFFPIFFVLPANKEKLNPAAESMGFLYNDTGEQIFVKFLSCPSCVYCIV